MIWHNYAAHSLHTSLSGKVIIPSSDLESIINKNSGTLFHCFYDLEKRDSYVDYSGHMKPAFDTIYLDLDSKKDDGLQAWEDTKKLCAYLIQEKCNFHLYFSGNKGFHIALHKSSLNITEGTSDEIQAQVKLILYYLKSVYSTMDTGIWNSNRKFRAYNSKHNVSGLYKIRLTEAGLPQKISSYTLEEIRALAKLRQSGQMLHPLPSPPLTSLLEKITSFGANVTPHQTLGAKNSGKQIKEISQGEIIDDESLRFVNFSEKLCTKKMQDSALPQCNRHDLGLRLIYEYRGTGRTLPETINLMTSWANKMFAGDKEFSERVAGTIRMVHDAYSKPQEYKFGCYDDIKKAYCSAKCKIYKQLSPDKRAEPLDVTAKQEKENSVRRLKEGEISADISEGELAANIVKSFTKPLIMSQGDFFSWEGTHWERGDRERTEAMLKTLASEALKHDKKVKSHHIQSLVNQIKWKLPVAPESNKFFSSSFHLENFSDGTVEISKNEIGKVVLTLREHRMDDYLGFCRPFPFSADHSMPRNGHLKHYFDSRLVDLGADGVRMLKQMLGAALIPYKPWIFFLIGETDSGKSTMAMMIKCLLGEKNVSGVEPTRSSNTFHWEPAIGKIANVVLELDKSTVLDVNTLKKIRDKTSVSINRKGIKAVDATLPFLHIYCANNIPPSYEGNSGALDNRVTIINFEKVYVNGLASIDNLGQWLWDKDAGAVLDAAREGLADLIESDFKYFRSQAALEIITEWQDSTDSVKLFVQDVESGEYDEELSVEVGKDICGKDYIKAFDLFQIYQSWSASRTSNSKSLGHISFYKNLARCTGSKIKKLEFGKAISWEKIMEKITPKRSEESVTRSVKTSGATSARMSLSSEF